MLNQHRQEFLEVVLRRAGSSVTIGNEEADDIWEGFKVSDSSFSSEGAQCQKACREISRDSLAQTRSALCYCSFVWPSRKTQAGQLDAILSSTMRILTLPSALRLLFCPRRSSQHDYRRVQLHVRMSRKCCHTEGQQFLQTAAFRKIP